MRNKKTVSSYFQDPSAQIALMQERLEVSLPTAAYEHVKTFIEKQALKEVKRIESKVEKELAVPLNETLEKLGNKETDNAERSQLMNRYFQLIHPSFLLSILEESLKPVSIEKEYQHFYQSAVDQSSFPTILKRYKANEKTFPLYMNEIYQSAGPLFKSLKAHGEQIQKHVDLMKSLAEEKGMKQALQIGAGIIGSLIAGPLGGMASRTAARSFTSDDNTINNSLSAVGDTWYKVTDAYEQFLGDMFDRYTLVCFVLYGGFILRVNDDLISCGYQVDDLEGEKCKLVIGVREKEQQRLVEWVSHNERNVVQALREGNFQQAEAHSRQLLDYLNQNEPAGRVMFEDEMGRVYRLQEYAVIIRYAVYNHYIDQQKWQQSDYQAAVQSYLDLLGELEVPVSQMDSLGDLPLIPLHQILIRIIQVTQTNGDVLDDQVLEVVLAYLEKIKGNEREPDNLFLQFSRVYYAFTTNYARRPSFLRIKVNYRELAEAYQGALEVNQLKSDTFFAYLKKNKSLQILHLLPLAEVNRTYRRLAETYKFIKPVFLLPALLTIFVLWNMISFNRTGVLAAGVDSIYFSHVENRILDTEMDNNSLGKAIDRDDLSRIDWLVTRGADPNTRSAGGNTALIQAIERNDIPLIKLLLGQGSSPDEGNDSQIFPLQLAVEGQSEEAIALLLAAGADINLKSQQQESLFLFVIKTENMELIKLFLDAGAKVNQGGEGGTLPLQQAILLENEALAALLLEHGANPLLQDDKGQNSFHVIAAQDYSRHLATILKLLLPEVAADSSIPDEVLVWAMDNAEKGIVGQLLQAGVNPDIKVNGIPLLFHALKDEETLKNFLSYGANLNIKDELGNTALLIAVEKNDLENVELLLEEGADINSVNQNKETALMKAVMRDNSKMVDLLLENDADLSLENLDEKTAAWLAVESSSEEMLTRFIERKQFSGEEMEQLMLGALGEEEIDTIQALLKAGVDPDMQSDSDTPIILMAVREEQLEIVTLLLEAGADPNARTDEEETPLMIAEEMGAISIQEVIREHGGYGENIVLLKSLTGYWRESSYYAEELSLVRILEEDDDFSFELYLDGKKEVFPIGYEDELYVEVEGEKEEIYYNEEFEVLRPFMDLSYERVTEEEYEELLQKQQQEAAEKEAEEQRQQQKLETLDNLVGYWKNTSKKSEGDRKLLYLFIEEEDERWIIDFIRQGNRWGLNTWGDEVDFEEGVLHFNVEGNKIEMIDNDTLRYTSDFYGPDYITFKRIEKDEVKAEYLD